MKTIIPGNNGAVNIILEKKEDGTFWMTTEIVGLGSNTREIDEKLYNTMLGNTPKEELN